jgi:zinc protease
MSMRHRPIAALVLGTGLVLCPPAVAVADDAGYELQAWTLDDGTEVLLVEDHRVPLVDLRIVFPVGSYGDWAWEHYASTAMAIQLYDADGEFRARADDLAADVSTYAGGYWSQMGCSCRKSDLPQVLSLLRDVMDNSSFDEAELRRWRKNRKVHWDSRDKDANQVRNRAVRQLFFQADDPRRRGDETLRLTPTSSRPLAQARDVVIRVPGRRIGISGDLTRDEADALVADLLPPPLEELPTGLEPSWGPVTEIGPDHDEQLPVARMTQVYFAYVRESLTIDDPHYAAFRVASHVLGGHFYSRLSVALRHEGGETYGAGAGGIGLAAPNPYWITTFTHTENAPVAEQKIRDVLRIFHADGITEQERLDALAWMRGHEPFDRQSPQQLLGRVIFERQLGLPRGFDQRVVQWAEALTLAEINEFIAGFFDPSYFAMIQVVPE